MSKKRLIALLLAAVLATTVIAPTALASEQPSSWAAEQVNSATAAGLVPQNLQSAYNQPITRAEFAALVVALYETATGAEITGRATFNDTNDINVQKAGYIGVVTGVGGGNFAPLSSLTREQAAVMLARLSEAIGQPLAESAPTFADNAQISSWAIDAVGKVQAAGIIGGTGNNMFSPQGDYTREQSIVTILRIYAPDTVPLPQPIPQPQPPTPPTSLPTGTPQIGSIITFGAIEWRVLDVQDDRALLISEYILFERAYHTDGATQNEIWVDGGIWADGFDWSRLNTTWEHSDIRAYLNGEFLSSFSAADRSRIAEVTNTNIDNQWLGTSGGNDTNDRIFLLSLEEVVRYFGDSGQLWNRPDGGWGWIADQYSDARVAYVAGEAWASWWWLRSPGNGSDTAALVGSDGGVDMNGNGVDNVYGGVRPALWLNLET